MVLWFKKISEVKQMIMKLCKRCNKLISYPRVYCTKCEAVVNKARAIQLNELNNNRGRGNSKGRAYRDPKYRRFYKSKQWHDLSKSYMLKQHYKCEVCGAIASEVHHKEPIQTPSGWNKRLDYNNLKAVCVRCHNKEHNRFNSRKKDVRN